ILPEASPKVTSLKIMRRQCIACQKSMTITGVNQCCHRLAAVLIKGNGRSSNPHDITVLAVVTEQFIKRLVARRKGSLTRATRSERKLFLGAVRRRCESRHMHQQSLSTIFASPHSNKVA